MEKEKTYPGQIGMLKLSIVMYIGMAVHSSLLVYKGFVLFTFDCAYCMGKLTLSLHYFDLHTVKKN